VHEFTNGIPSIMTITSPSPTCVVVKMLVNHYSIFSLLLLSVPRWISNMPTMISEAPHHQKSDNTSPNKHPPRIACRIDNSYTTDIYKVEFTHAPAV